MTQEESHAPGPPAAPPTVRPAAPPERERSKWPAVIGIGSIVVGILSALSGIYNIVAGLFLGDTMTAGAQNGSMADAMREGIRLQGFVGGAKVLVAPLLIAGGIALVRRRAWSVTALTVWSALKLPIGAATAWYTVQVQNNVAASTPMPGAPPGMMGGIMNMMSVVTGAVTLGWEWALPVFLVVWFFLPKVRAEVRSWRGPGREVGSRDSSTG